MRRWRCRSRSPAETQATARALAEAVGSEGLLFALCGALGTGKTVFVRGLAEGLGIAPQSVTSPTFVIAAHHESPTLPLVHADLYRVECAEDLATAGWYDWLAPGALLAVEWADRFSGLLPADHLQVRMARPQSPRQAGVREIMFSASGPRAQGVLARGLAGRQIPGLEADP